MSCGLRRHNINGFGDKNVLIDLVVFIDGVLVSL